MNISQIRARLRAAFNLGQLVANNKHSGAAGTARENEQRFSQSLVDLDDLPPPDWFECERISDIDAVDDAFRNFVDDATADNATCLVQAVITAYLKGQ